MSLTGWITDGHGYAHFVVPYAADAQVYPVVWLLDGELGDKKWKALVRYKKLVLLRKLCDTQEEAMAAVEQCLVTLKLEGKI